MFCLSTSGGGGGRSTLGWSGSGWAAGSSPSWCTSLVDSGTSFISMSVSSAFCSSVWSCIMRAWSTDGRGRTGVEPGVGWVTWMSMGAGCRVPGWGGGEDCSACCLLDSLLVMMGVRVSWEGRSAVPSPLVGLSAAPEPYVSAAAFSSSGIFESAVLDSAALASCFFTGVDCEVRLALAGAACLTFSGGVLSPSERCSLGAKHGRQASKPPDRLDLLRVDPSRGAVAGTGGGGWLAFSEAAAAARSERLLLAVLPARRLLRKLRFECFEARPMLSASAAVAPLRPVPVGVASSFAFDEPAWGTPRNGCFCLESASAVLRCSPVGGSRDDERGGTTVLWGPTAHS